MKVKSAIEIDELDFKKGNGLIPVIVQEYSTRKVLMLAYMNKEALMRTLETGIAHYYSRSRRKLWMKGETSGHIQIVRRIFVDCDNDTILLQVEQVGNACHTGEHTCFHKTLKEGQKIHEKFNEHIKKLIKKVFEESKTGNKSNSYLGSKLLHYPELYEWIAEKIDENTPDDIDKVIALEGLSIPIAQLVASRKGKPLIVMRSKQSESKNGEHMYIHSVKHGEKVLIIDTTISDTLTSIVDELVGSGVRIAAIVCLISSEKCSSEKLIRERVGVNIYSIISI
ncbi:MAG TPA: phosphoribosyl-AMP cyclohydrolase [Desulfurococcales archaeon]|nr:phosphoribosyl-AMP cyclohydrolase [Desulfurococcales archaeon]